MEDLDFRYICFALLLKYLLWQNKSKDQPKFGCSYLLSSDLIQMKIAYAITSAYNLIFSLLFQ